LLLLATLFAACDASDVAGPEAPRLDEVLQASATSAPPGQRGGTSLFDELAEDIRGFGGLYRTGPCAVAVVLTDMSQAEHAIQVVHAALAPLVSHPCPPGGVQVSAVQGQFTYLQLKAFLRAAQPLLQIRGVARAGIDYQLNRLVIFVQARSVVAEVLEALPRLRIPAEAVVFKPAS
jgi:hypothetical protein